MNSTHVVPAPHLDSATFSQLAVARSASDQDMLPQAALALPLFFGAALVAIAFCILWRVERSKTLDARQRAAQLAQENEQRKATLVALFGVLEGEAGGVTERIHEHNRLASAIQKRAPELVRVEPDLVRWLNRHDRFYKALRTAAALDH
jgi:Tfp pilus assembly protein PilN